MFVFGFAFEYFVSSDCPMILCYYFMTQKKTFSHMCIICELKEIFRRVRMPQASSVVFHIPIA